MKVCVMFMHGFPFGMASASRLSAYSKGLIEQGAKVDVLMPFPDDAIIQDGTISGIRYFHTYGRRKSRSKIVRGITRISGFKKYKALWKAYRYLTKNTSNEYDIILAHTDTISHMLTYSKAAKHIGAKCVFVADEYPIPIRHKLKERIPRWKEVSYGIVLKRFDAYVFISDALSNYYNRLCPKPTHIMQVITDVTRFSGIICDNELSVRQYLCYMGNMELAKDNVDLIIKAFAKISNGYPDIDLHLYGSPSNRTYEYLSRIINSMNLSDRVFIKGRAEYGDIPQILANAHILLASQPQTMRASGGFPTKLGEYLASGKPAIVTRVGENDKYVTDMQHAYFVVPDNVESYADKIRYILNNYEIALLVANEGRKLIIDNYSQSANGYALIRFLQNMLIK